MGQILPFRSPKLQGSEFEFTGFSGGSGGGNMEVRVARLESDVEHIKNDVSDIKIDLREMRTSFAAEMKDTRKDFKEEMQDMRKAFKEDMAGMRSDYRWLMTGGATAFVLLAGMFITGYLRLEVAIQAITK